MRLGEALNFQRKNGDREQLTGFRRTDNYQSTVGKPNTAIIVIWCILPLLFNGVLSIINAFKGGGGNDCNKYSGGDNRNRNQSF